MDYPGETNLISRVDTFGCPWHGLWESDLLLLSSNWSTIQWVSIGDHGNADLIRIVGLPVPTRTVDEAAAGMAWRNYALITGSTRVFYGMQLGAGHWIYVPEIGNAFHLWISSVNTCTGTASGGAIDLTISAAQCVFGADTGVVTFDASLSDIGQGQWEGEDITIVAAGVVLSAQSESGAKILIELQKAGVIIGWMEGTVTGTSLETLSLSLAVAKTRAQTIWRSGTYSEFVTDNQNFESSSDLSEGFVFSGWYEGETAGFGEARFRCTNTTAASGGSVNQHLTDYYDLMVDGVSKASALYVFDYNRPTCTGDASVSATWDGVLDDPIVTVYSGTVTGPGGDCPAPGALSGIEPAHTNYINAWIADDDDKAYYYGKVLTDPTARLVRMLPYRGVVDYAASYSTHRGKYAMGISKAGRNAGVFEMFGFTNAIKLQRLMMHGHVITLCVNAPVWNNQGNLRVAFQPHPDSEHYEYRLNSSVVGYV